MLLKISKIINAIKRYTTNKIIFLTSSIALSKSSFVIADKMPTFLITEESQVEPIFKEQLERCGVDYFDFYMVHNVSSFSEAGWKYVDTFGFCTLYTKIAIHLLLNCVLRNFLVAILFYTLCIILFP